MKLSKEQNIQEGQYEFPYHYIPSADGEGFSQTKTLRWGYEYMAYLDFVLDLLAQHRFDSLLDVGCGDGRLLFELDKKFKNKKLAGIDYSARSIAFAKAFNPNIKFLVGNITKDPLTEEKYDAVTLIEVLEHIAPESAPGFLVKLAGYLKPGGMLLLTVPSKNIPLNAKHYRHFGTKDLLAALEPYFEVREFHFLNKISPLEKVIRRILDNRLFALKQKNVTAFLYKFYKEKLLAASEGDAKRICVVARKR